MNLTKTMFCSPKLDQVCSTRLSVFFQDTLVQLKIYRDLAQSLVLPLKVLAELDFSPPHIAVQLAPSVVDLVTDS